MMAEKSSVFQSDTLTPTNLPVPKAGGDNHIPTEGSVAEWLSITSSKFIDGPEEGQDQNLFVSHDKTYDIEKNRKTHIKENEELNIKKNRTTKITKDENSTIGGNQTIEVAKTSKLQAEKVEITGLQEITLKVGGNHITIDVTGITVFGSLVKINC
jgi:uncharacterized protein involved in type VI secretion and phage assembly